MQRRDRTTKTHIVRGLESGYSKVEEVRKQYLLVHFWRLSRPLLLLAPGIPLPTVELACWKSSGAQSNRRDAETFGLPGIFISHLHVYLLLLASHL